MNQLTNFYRNKAEDLQRQVNLLEQKINDIINEGVVQDFKREFTTFPLAKAAGSGIAHPIDTAKAGADLVSKGVKFAAKNPGSAIKATGLGALGLGIPLAAGAGVEYGVDELLKYAGLDKDKEGTISSIGGAINNPDAEIETPSSREMLSSAAGWGAMGAVGQGIINYGVGAPIAAGMGGAAATGAAAGAAVPLVAYGAVKAGQAIGDPLYGVGSITGEDVKKKAEEMGVDFSAPKERPTLKDIQAKTQKEREESEERARQREAKERKFSSWEQMAGAKYSG
jgi:hypothetical protein